MSADVLESASGIRLHTICSVPCANAALENESLRVAAAAWDLRMGNGCRMSGRPSGIVLGSHSLELSSIHH